MNLRLSTPLTDRLRSTILSLAERLPVIGAELRSLRDYASLLDEMSRMLRRARPECMVSEGVVESLRVLLAELETLRAQRDFRLVKVGPGLVRARGGDA